MQHDSLPHIAERGLPEARRLSYKFQRIREQLRQAIRRGDFSGQLPGERELGRRLEANAKTINKALCDLASEGLLVRVIGRGTFVAEGNGRSPSESSEKVFHLFDAADCPSRPHRKAMIAAIGNALVRKGRRLDCHRIERLDEHGRVPVGSWHSSNRRTTAGLISFAADRLSGGNGGLDDNMIREAWRRHVPMIVLSGCAEDLKLSAVMPDYVAAGFSCAEHQFLLGCRRVVVLTSDQDGRETGMVMTGCRTAALRHDCLVTRLHTGEKDWPGRLLAEMGNANGDAATTQKAAVGIVCVGSSALAAARADTTVARLVTFGELAVTCIMEPGDATPQQTNLTAYEFDVNKIADWTVRLLLDARQGQRPIEVIVPGELCIRETVRPQSSHNGRNGTHAKGAIPSRMSAVDALI